MKISKVEVFPLEAELDFYIGRARQAVPLKARRALLVRLTTDEGLVGYGEGLTPVSPKTAARVVKDVLEPFVLEKDPIHSEPIWETLYAANSSRGYNRGYQMIAVSALDMAIWDLKGKILNRPVYELLGGCFTDPVPAYATGLMFAETVTEVVSLAGKFYNQGFRAMKLKVGADYRFDLEAVSALRKEFGPELRIMVDANGGFDPPTALKVGRLLEERDVFWFEEPVEAENLKGLARVRDRLSMYVAAGECEYTKYGVRELILGDAVDVVQPDIARAGGFTECRRIASLAHSFNLRYAPHAWGSVVCLTASAHLSASIPNLLLCECDRVPNPLRDELAETPPTLTDGCIHLSKKPGLGLEITDKSIKQFLQE
jgi:L-alanine-DL-glutamate epimerase-like enolase superfamily enzyme